MCGIVRGLAYYTGIVFEAFDRAGKFRAIAGGGRYDNLIAQLSDGAVSMPALGFAMGDVVLGELIDEIPHSTRSDAESDSERKQDRHLRRHRKGRTPCRRARPNPATARPRLPHRLPAHANESRPAVPGRRRFGRARRASLRRRVAAGESEKYEQRRAELVPHGSVCLRTCKRDPACHPERSAAELEGSRSYFRVCNGIPRLRSE